MGLNIQVNFKNFSLLDYDGSYLKFYDGRTSSAPLIATMKGSTYQNVSTNGSELCIEFYSSWWHHYYNFLRYSRINNWYGFHLNYYGKLGMKFHVSCIILLVKLLTLCTIVNFSIMKLT